MSTLKVLISGFAIALTGYYTFKALETYKKEKKEQKKEDVKPKEKTIFEKTIENCQSEGEWPLSEEKEQLKKDFEDAFYAIEKEVPFNDKWHNGTGYLNGGVNDDLGLNDREKARSIDPLTGRKIIIIGAKNRDGNITNCLYFERNIPGKGPYCIVSNYDRLDNVPSWS